MFLRRIGDAIYGIGKAGSDGGYEKTGCRGCDAGARCHRCRRRLVACQMKGNTGPFQPVDQGHHLAARHAESVANTMGMQRCSDRIGNAWLGGFVRIRHKTCASREIVKCAQIAAPGQRL